MCIIAVKRPEIAPPTDDILKRMFKKNPDGSGVAWSYKGVLHIVKGLMSEAEFLDAAHKIPQDAPAIYHTRIQTSGGVNKELTHPFLIDADIKKQRQTKVATSKGAALAHNGIFSQYKTKELNNDTTQFITNNIAPLKALKDKTGGQITDADIKNIIDELADGSRVAILTASGALETYGSGWQTDKGIKYSNSNYKEYQYTYKEYPANYSFYEDIDDYYTKAAQKLRKQSKEFDELCKKCERDLFMDEGEVYQYYGGSYYKWR